MLCAMGRFFVTSLPRRLAFGALALALPLGLAACGVKGPLEPPPNSGVVDPRAEAPPPQNGTGPLSGPAYQAPGSTAGLRQPAPRAVVNAPAAQQRSFLDWLTD
jgi:predicted small lipoprotein YifL